MNYGIPAINGKKEKFYVENVLLDFNPDLLIIYDGVNDLEPRIEVYDEEGNVYIKTSGATVTISRELVW